MKKRKTITTLLALVMAFSSIGGIEPAYAATGIKKATLNNAKVRFNNGYVQTLQCYNIDGYNYVRARDITNNLGMAVSALQEGGNGISINPFSAPASVSALEKLTQKTATVRVEKGNIVYDGIPYSAECFLLKGRYYFKLADFASAADESVGITLMYLKMMEDMGMGGDYFFNYYPTISVMWNNATKIIDVQTLIIDARSASSDVAIPDEPISEPEYKYSDDLAPEVPIEFTDYPYYFEDLEEFANTFVPQAPLTSAPKVGTVLADILIDENAPTYIDELAHIHNSENYTAPYRWVAEEGPYFAPVGECVWYAWGRFIETHGAKVLENPFERAAEVSGWVENANGSLCPDLKGVTDPYDIEPRSIVVWDGHAGFVEWVEYDDNGKPEWVYFTEANANHYGNLKPGIYYPDYDCKVQKLDMYSFINRAPFVGYVVMK